MKNKKLNNSGFIPHLKEWAFSKKLFVMPTFDETIKNSMNYSEIIRGVLDVAVKISGEEESVIISSTKTKKISTIRSIVLFVLHNDMSVPTSKIAEKFGRSRRSIFWHCNKMAKQLPLYKEYREIREEILRMLR